MATSPSAFTDFDLIASLQASLKEQGFVTPTEIQRRALPLLLAGRSVVGVAETGGGKTLAYVLPVLNALKSLEDGGQAVEGDAKPRAIVIVPTRELGEQVTKVFKRFTHTTRLRVRSLLGGTTMEVARRNIHGVFEVLVATPGRLIKLLDRELVDLGDVRVLVFDEVDQMLDPGFLPDAERIVGACPGQRQLALFSATVPPGVQDLIGRLFADAVVLRSEGSHRVVPSLTTVNRTVHGGKRHPILRTLLAEKVTGGTLIFANTRKQCDQLVEDLREMGRECAVYRGEMDKIERRANLKAFRDGTVDLLVSTDLAARGLDVEHVGRVINYHLPEELDAYLHRVGRTARAGRPGVVINLVTERDQGLMEKIERAAAAPRKG
ncbi:MAG: DEAD/DEAH box helicase [Deltaproteobacteria bacterium]|jgi:ATP-dependent RNA helicase RhlE|nr:DEAD/DEAH box helicase [Deltaproteobacteria bacterium]